jgi:hypothetical protein
MFRILIWLFELCVLVTLGALVLANLAAPRRSFSGVLRGAANLVIALVTSMVVALGFGLGGIAFGAADPMADALLAAILALPITLWSLDRRGKRRRGERAGAFAHRGVHSRAGRSALAPEPAADDAVAIAWTRAGRLAPLQRSRLTAARQACAYVLHWSEGHPFDMESMECAVLIRKRLPELVEQTASFAELSGKTERREAIDNMVRDCESLGRMALTRVEESKARIGDSLAATRAHIASRTNENAAF